MKHLSVIYKYGQFWDTETKKRVIVHKDAQLILVSNDDNTVNFTDDNNYSDFYQLYDNCHLIKD